VTTTSLRAYARHRGCALNAVQEAIRSGRLTKSVKRVKGRPPQIANVAAADAEWAASTYSDRVPLTGRTAPHPSPPELPPITGVHDLAEARARHEAARASLTEIELAERRGELVPTKDVEARLVGEFTRCKTKLLGIPSRARQQDPGLTTVQLALIEGLIREALDDLASDEVVPEPVSKVAP
jgi:hypothetical protein